METKMNRIMNCALTGVCALAVLGLSANTPVQAQGKMKRQRSDSAMSSTSSMDGSMYKDGWDDYYTYHDPAPLSYPMAAPGTIGLYHYDSYRHNIIMTGNTTDTRMDRERRMEMREMHGMMNKDDEMMADPAPIDYPLAAPGTISLYHFDTYRGNRISVGSVTDARMDKEKMRDERRFGMAMRNDRQMIEDPYPISYPFAAPGALDLYSFKDYMANELQEGSVSDHKMEAEKKRDRMNRTAPSMSK